MSDRQVNNAIVDAPQIAHEVPILFFDGVCGLCNWFVDFILTRDSDGIFRFAPLQGSTAARSISAEDVASLRSVVLLDAAGSHRRSSAVVRVLRRLGGIWSVMGILLWIVPLPLRDLGYACVAATRYGLFGRRETCRMPTLDERKRFLP